MPEEKQAFTTFEVADFCHVSPNSVGRWLHEGKIRHFKTAGGRRRVWRRDLIRLLESLDIPAPPELDGRGQSRILIVEDEAKVRRTLKRMTSRAFPEADIHEAADGFEAGRKIAAVKPGIIVLDIFLPGVDGFQLCRKIRSDAELKHIKVLAVSGEDVEETGRKAIAAGADAFLSKPFTPKDIEQALRKWLPQTAEREQVGERPGFILREKANG
ncbi:response regulator [Elusimicrobiota bacterium]